jgi:hypothetical protein
MELREIFFVEEKSIPICCWKVSALFSKKWMKMTMTMRYDHGGGVDCREHFVETRISFEDHQLC